MMLSCLCSSPASNAFWMTQSAVRQTEWVVATLTFGVGVGGWSRRICTLVDRPAVGPSDMATATRPVALRCRYAALPT